MHLGIIHLSDIHFRSGRFDNAADKEMAESICAAVRTELIGNTHIILLVSGDIAYAGLEDEYEYAIDWFSELYTKIADSVSATCWIICAPGNHDLDHSSNSTIRNLIIDRIKNNPKTCIDSELIESCIGPQSAFFEFRESLESRETVVCDNELLRIHRVSDETTNVQINILNSAWMSSLKESHGSIVYPIERFADQLKPSEGFAITVLHHPLSWFEPENSRQLRNRISEFSSICFCGHEHMPDSIHMSTSIGDQVKLIDGGVLKSHDDSSNSSFNLVILDTDAHKIKEKYIYKKRKSLRTRSSSRLARCYKTQKCRIKTFPP